MTYSKDMRLAALPAPKNPERTATGSFFILSILFYYNVTLTMRMYLHSSIKLYYNTFVKSQNSENIENSHLYCETKRCVPNKTFAETHGVCEGCTK